MNQIQQSLYFFLLSLVTTFSTSFVMAQEVSPGGNGTALGFEAQSANLTDQEKDISDKYIHKGLSNRIKEIECGGSQKKQDACAGIGPDKVMKISPGLISAASKAYSMIIGMGGGKMGTFKTSKFGKKVNKNSENPDEVQDYCRYGALATETVATFQQMASSKNLQNIPSNEKNLHRDLLLKAARTHDERAKTAKIQFIGWTATASCYGAMSTMINLKNPRVLVKFIIKAGAATFFAIYSREVQKAQEQYRTIVKSIADKLPHEGDCNPITQNHCFCLEESSKLTPEYPKYCEPYLHQAFLQRNQTRTSCVDSKLQADPGCRCLKTNSCFEKTFIEGFSGLNLGKNFQKTSLEPISQISKGRVSEGSLAHANLGKAAKRFLKKLDDYAKENSPGPLTRQQKEEVKAMNKMGIPLSLAAHMATIPKAKNNSALSKKFRKNWRRKKYRLRGKKNKILHFNGGGGLDARRKSKSKRGFNFKRKKRKKKNSGKVLTFSQRATRSAQINRNEGQSLFKIISRRYQVSQKRRLEL